MFSSPYYRTIPALLVVLASCGEDDSPAADANVLDQGRDSSLQAVCENKEAAAPGLQTRAITVSGVDCSFELSIPSNYDNSKPARLVFGWHGLGGSGALLRSYTSVEAESVDSADTAATVFAYPDGLLRSSFGTTAWVVADTDVFDAILAELDTELCIDSSRVFSYGHSLGGYFSNALGCLRGNSLRAIAPVAGGPVQGLGNCESAMPAWLAHASNDSTVPVSEGIAARDNWIAENQCSQTTVAVDPSPCQAYQGCSGGAQVVWCETATGGHDWPAYANPGIWAFFAGFDEDSQ